MTPPPIAIEVAGPIIAVCETQLVKKNKDKIKIILDIKIYYTLHTFKFKS
jgi:hypothetical protein